jgi:four helix bundle protein
MGTLKSFEEIQAWQKARELIREIYGISKKSSFSKDFALCDQIRRAGVSIMSNIAEGFERGGTKEFFQFLAIAKGSTGEVRTHLYIACDQEYLTKAEFDHLLSLSLEVSRMIAGLMAYLQKTKIKGSKYK